ncbi:helix-turn-helix transcriptional regulator [Streptomyces camelliae]|uniref:Helix-turn-helix transcriptional regulator n=1 Tax=Streptomyces camelliae TaxID=3004093 RepID=A0ABY7P8N4_9ACTN|nr:helix-turn-helix transcriptional regulator [Streptomyces sp. HUAS 2-6]WBO65683.1 helix-turn-helix transcriptional regulator [Streptomyces sp. HUAS 2-6]
MHSNDAQMLVLTVLADGPLHGYAINTAIEELTGRRLGPGSLYGALSRLEGRGLIQPADEAAGSQERHRTVRITDAGRDQLRAELHQMTRISGAGLRPDVVVYRADTIDITPTRPEHVLLVAEVVSPGSETTDRIVKVDQYAKAGIGFYWRIEQAATGVPLVYTYVLDPATKTYRDGDVFTGVLKVAAPFPVEIDLGQI